MSYFRCCALLCREIRSSAGVSTGSWSSGTWPTSWRAPGVNTGLWLVNTDQVTWMVACHWSILVTWHKYWSILVTWPEYWPKIGQDWSHDLSTSLWLVNTDHVTWILSTDWTYRYSILTSYDHFRMMVSASRAAMVVYEHSAAISR